jgi:tight adherence protein B
MNMGGSGVFIYLGLVFAAVFFLSQGMIVPAFGESRKTRKLLKKRLDEIDRQSLDDGMASLLRERYLRKLSPIERRLEAIPAMEALGAVIEQSGNRILAYRLVILSVAFAASLGVITWIVTRMPLVAVGGFVIGGAGPFLKILRDRANRFAQIEEQLPDAIDIMRRALMAGHPFNASLKLVSEDMSEPIAREFELTFADINFGNDARRAMLGLLSRVPSVTVMAFVTAVLVQKETGGNLAEILNQIANVVRGRFRFQRRVRTLSAEGRMSAWVLALVPLILFGAMAIMNPDYLPILFEEPLGRKLAALAFVWAGIGLYWIRRIIRIEV